jgi:hypothetical protein
MYSWCRIALQWLFLPEEVSTKNFKLVEKRKSF